MPNQKLSLICMECGKEFFRYKAIIPTCPRCKSTDIDVGTG